MLLFSIFTLLTLTHCDESNTKTPILLADREAPVGWVSLRIYIDSTFEYCGTKYQGKVIFKGDTLLFQYKDSIPNVGKTAVLTNNCVVYSAGYRERLGITLNKLKK